MRDLFKLYDYIEINMAKYYKEKFPVGKYGLTKGVSVAKMESCIGLNFMAIGWNISHRQVSSIRFGCVQSSFERKKWCVYLDENPFIVVDDLGGELVATTVERSRTLGNNPQSVGKDSGNWKTLYMTVKLGLLE